MSSRPWIAILALATLYGCTGDDSTDGRSGSRSLERTRTADAAAVARESDRDGGPEPTSESWLRLEEPGATGGTAVELARAATRGTNSVGIAPTLHLRCEHDTAEVYIVWYEDPEGEDNDVTTQVDARRAIRRTWTNVYGEASVFPRDSAGHFIDELLTADSLTVRSNLYKRMPVTVVFDLSGLSDEIDSLRERCPG